MNSPAARAQLLWHTLRHLRLQQIINRLARRFRRVVIDPSPAPSRRPIEPRWLRCRRGTSMTGPVSFRFLSEARTLQSDRDWHNHDWPRLWLYNLHYFDDLVSVEADAHQDWHQQLVWRWIRENRPMDGPGWEPYPLSLRLVNWIKWFLGGKDPSSQVLDSVALQARCLEQQLEYHLLGNHLWANGKALVFAGSYFIGAEAERWRSTGERILVEQLSEQVLDDGGHFERSPMYHAIFLEDLLDLLQLAAQVPSALAPELVTSIKSAARSMWRWLAVMSHPDGELSFFNDSAIGIAPTLATLADYASDIELSLDRTPLRAIEHLATSGYVRLSRGTAVVLVDVGPIGPDYLPGHAHADTLSFEFSLNGRRVLSNGGTSTYASGPERAAQRGTSMHNTVVVDGQDSSEVWSSFRVGRRARPISVVVEEVHGTLRVLASHDGYRRLPGKPVHTRTITLSEFELCVDDRVHGRSEGARAYFRFSHPAKVRPGRGVGSSRVSVDEVELEFSASPEDLEWVEGTWHPRFGVSLPVYVAVAGVGTSGSRACMRWS